MGSLTSKELVAKTKTPGKITIVNLWATWCEPCKAEMPELLAFRKKNLARGVELVLIDADSPGERKEAEAFLAKLGVDFQSYFMGESPEDFMKPLVEGWPATLPTTLVYNATGKRVGYWVGKIKMKDLEKAVR